jgi:hypothetical protein
VAGVGSTSRTKQKKLNRGLRRFSQRKDLRRGLFSLHPLNLRNLRINAFLWNWFLPTGRAVTSVAKSSAVEYACRMWESNQHSPTCRFNFFANLVSLRARAARLRPAPGAKRKFSSGEGERVMGKGNNSQKNDKKNKKPKQDAKKPDAKSGGKK